MTAELYEKLTEIRRDIYQRPGVSERESNTTELLESHILNLGIRIVETGLKTGFIAEIGQSELIIVPRADIDALPIREANTFDYAGKNGAMHAYGHDFHQASLLGAAELLKAKEADTKGTIRLISRLAEEVATGADAVIETGGIEGVFAIIGYHNNPHLRPGQTGLRSKAIMAAIGKFKVTATGISSHVARPDSGIDTILTITTIVNNLQMIISRTVSLFGAVMLSVTHIDAGTTWNVLPDLGYFEGMIRSFTSENRQYLRERFTKIVKNTAEQFGAKATIEWGKTPTVTYDDKTLIPFISEYPKQFMEVLEVAPLTGGEDFAIYQEHIPGVFALIGSNGDNNAAGLHHDTFTVKDEALLTAVNYYVQSVSYPLDYYHSKKDWPCVISFIYHYDRF